MQNVTHMSFEIEVLLIALVFIGVLAAGAYFAIPGSLRRLALNRAYRLDGTFSERRQRIERSHLLKFVGEAVSGPLLVSLPVLVIGILLHQRVVPFDIAWKTLTSFSPDEESWRERVEETARSEHSAWAESRGYDKEQILALQHQVWRTWPLILLTLIAGAVVAYVGSLSYLRRLIIEYETGLLSRCQQYRLADLSRVRDSPQRPASGNPNVLL